MRGITMANMPNSTQRTAVPLSEAAARLGISPNALRMRVARGRAQGIRRDGRLYILMDETSQTAPAGTTPDTSVDEVDTVLELQRTELNRLLTENRRLSERLDNLLELLREEQASRRALQDLLGDIARQRSPTPSTAGYTTRLASMERTHRALSAAVLQMAESFDRGSRAAIQIETDRRLRNLETDAATARITLAEIARHLRTKHRRSQT